MLEFISSKVVSAIAVVALIASVAGFFAIERSALEEQRFREMCTALAATIDSVSCIPAQERAEVVFGDGAGALRMDSSFRGKGYEIEIMPGWVVLRQDGLQAMCMLMKSVHPWDPSEIGNGTMTAKPGLLASMDSGHGSFKSPSGKGFSVERLRVSVLGTPSFETFVHA